MTLSYNVSRSGPCWSDLHWNRKPALDFDRATPSVVRSIKQRDFLNIWLRLYAREQSLPRIDEFQPARIEDELPDLVFLTVDTSCDPAGIIIQSDGTRMTSAYGNPGKGRDLEDYLGVRLAPMVVPIYRQCIARRLPATPFPISTMPPAGLLPMNACCCRSRKAATSRTSWRR